MRMGAGLALGGGGGSGDTVPADEQVAGVAFPLLILLDQQQFLVQVRHSHRDHQPSARFQVLHGGHHRRPGRRSVNNAVQLLRRPILRMPCPHRAQAAGERLFVGTAGKYINR